MVACFLVERFGQRRASQRSCDTLHGPDEPCNQNAVSEITIFDVRRPDTGEVLALGRRGMYDLPVGAMFGQWMSEKHRPTGPQDWPPEWKDIPTGATRQPSTTFADGSHLHVITPGGTWNIDSRAQNCGSPFDYEHRCWVRHGNPPLITVDKQGLTCSAGAGSIQCGTYHGFLQDGRLT